MKASKEVAMALMEELLQQHNPVNLLRFLSEEQEQLPPPLLLKTSKCSFPNQGHTQAEKILLPAVLWDFLHSGKNAQEKTNNGKEGGTKAVSQNLIKPRSRITVSTWEKKRFGCWYFRKALNVKEKKQPAITYREKPMVFKEHPRRRCTCWLEHSVPELDQLKSKKKGRGNSGSEFEQSLQDFSEQD